MRKNKLKISGMKLSISLPYRKKKKIRDCYKQPYGHEFDNFYEIVKFSKEAVGNFTLK